MDTRLHLPRHTAQGLTRPAIISIAVSIDNFSSLLLDVLRANAKISRNEMCQIIIGSVMKNAGAKSRFRKFFREIWPEIIYGEGLKRVTRFNWLDSLDDFLIGFSQSLLGGPNRSGLFRILIAWYAFEQGVVELAETTRYTLKVKVDDAPASRN